MKEMVRITILELKKLLKKRGFIFGLLIVFVMGCGMTYGAYIFPKSFGVHNVIAFYGNFASILIMFLGAKSLGEEFDLRTITFVFTSRCSRPKIVIAKILSIVIANMIIGLFGGILYNAALVICGQPWTPVSLLVVAAKEILIYMIYGFLIGAVALLITVIHNTTITPFIFLICLFWVLPGLLQMIGQKFSAIGKVLDYVVFCIADQFLMYQDWSVKNVAVFVITGLIVSAAAIGILEKKDL